MNRTTARVAGLAKPKRKPAPPAPVVVVAIPEAPRPRMLLEVPLPPWELSPNNARKVPHLVKNEATNLYRDTCFVLALDHINRHGWERPEVVRVSLLFCLARSARPKDGFFRPKDPDNAIGSFKAGLDGLRRAGVMVDDDFDHLEFGKVKRDLLRGPFVEVTVEAVG